MHYKSSSTHQFLCRVLLLILPMAIAQTLSAQIATYRVTDNELNNIHNTYLSLSPLQAHAQGAVPRTFWPSFSIEMGHRMGRLGSIQLFYQKQLSVDEIRQVSASIAPFAQFGGTLTYTFDTRIGLTEKRINLRDEKIKIPYVKIHGKQVRQFEVRGGFLTGKLPIEQSGTDYMQFGITRVGFQYVVTDRLKAQSRFGFKRYLKQKQYYVDLAYAPVLFAEQTAEIVYQKMRWGLCAGFQIHALRTLGFSWGMEAGFHPTVHTSTAFREGAYVRVKLCFPFVSLRLPTPKKLLYEQKD